MLLDVGRIDHYEHRLKALHYKKKFNERMTDAKNKVEGESRVVWIVWKRFVVKI